VWWLNPTAAHLLGAAECIFENAAQHRLVAAMRLGAPPWSGQPTPTQRAKRWPAPPVHAGAHAALITVMGRSCVLPCGPWGMTPDGASMLPGQQHS
jgi:predicted cobalt transporter CbtA